MTSSRLTFSLSSCSMLRSANALSLWKSTLKPPIASCCEIKSGKVYILPMNQHISYKRALKLKVFGAVQPDAPPPPPVWSFPLEKTMSFFDPLISYLNVIQTANRFPQVTTPTSTANGQTCLPAAGVETNQAPCGEGADGTNRHVKRQMTCQKNRLARPIWPPPPKKKRRPPCPPCYATGHDYDVDGVKMTY